ncbi:MAG: PDZ domain-containing protein [Cytophagales bacterium]|nr:PDZ domain-containing protein [Cytophagales bacterium]MDW8384475.1 PDZ domain-containing protein [Flammeovirgaceae bacterium]
MGIYQKTVFSLLFIGYGLCANAQSLFYTLRFPEPQTHYAEVVLEIKDVKQDSLDLKLPTWAPGSYLIREFSKNVERVFASADDKPIPIRKINKNTWRVYTQKKKFISIKYSVYAFEWTVRTSIVDETHAYLNGSNVFMFVKGLEHLPIRLKIEPYQSWNKISTQLPMEAQDPWIRTAPNYDFLADSPLEIGNHEVVSFEVLGVPHEFAIYGVHAFDIKKLIEDTKKIVLQAVKVFGEHPCPNYTFIVHCGHNLGGGLEHLNSTTVMTESFTGATPSAYANFLGLIAHEYFHLWNAKRLRPDALAKVDYENESYTSLLWIVEGFTSYYDDLLCYRAGIINRDFYLQEVLAKNIHSVVCTPGDSVQSLAESSLDTWIKYYRKNENTRNSQVNYYQKGSVIGMLLDMEIIKSSQGKYNLDTLMARLYHHFFKKGKTYSENDVKQQIEFLVGKSLTSFWQNYIYGTNPIPYEEFFAPFGLKLVYEPQKLFLGILVEERNCRLYVKEVERSSPAWRAGISAQDELLSINGHRIESKAFWDNYMNYLLPSQVVQIMVSRYNRVQEIPVNTGNYANCPFIQIKPLQDSSDNFIQSVWLKTSE